MKPARPPRRKRPSDRSASDGKPPRGPRRPPGSGPAGNRPDYRPAKTSAGWLSRLAAADLLFRTMDGAADLESALVASDPYNRLEGPDRGYARATASAALRALGRIDWALGGMLERPLADIEPPVRALLRAGCAQLWLLDSSDYAVVSACVEAARKWDGARRGGGLVNAVLRRAARERDAFTAAPETSIWPDWLAARLTAALGPDRAAALARLQLLEPPIDLTVRDRASAPDWAERLGGEALPNGSVRLKAGHRIEELEGYDEGAWWVQDAGATLAASLLGEVRGLKVADLCAAPGGKALQLAAAGADLTAVDISRQRLATLESNAGRTRLPMTVLEADVREWAPDGLFDAILLDAPCSALGVLRRHPEGAWRRDPADLARFPKIQKSLIDAAHRLLRPGGVMVYCVCTPVPEEGRDVIDAAVADGAWRRSPIDPTACPGFEHAFTQSGDLLTAPQSGDALTGRDAAPHLLSDVFYCARLERTA